MLLTRKQRAVLKLTREGLTPAEIARTSGMHPVSVYQLLARAKRRLGKAGLSLDKLLAADRFDLLDMVA